MQVSFSHIPYTANTKVETHSKFKIFATIDLHFLTYHCDLLKKFSSSALLSAFQAVPRSSF